MRICLITLFSALCFLCCSDSSEQYFVFREVASQPTDTLHWEGWKAVLRLEVKYDTGDMGREYVRRYLVSKEADPRNWVIIRGKIVPFEIQVDTVKVEQWLKLKE